MSSALFFHNIGFSVFNNIFAYGSFDEGYEYDYLTLEGDANARGGSWYDEDRSCNVIQIYPSKSLDEYNITVFQDASKANKETCTFTSGNWQLYQNNTNAKTNTFTVNDGVLLYKVGLSTSTSHTLNLVTE